MRWKSRLPRLKSRKRKIPGCCLRIECIGNNQWTLGILRNSNMLDEEMICRIFDSGYEELINWGFYDLATAYQSLHINY